MSELARFAYAQARLQARHGARPNEAVWLQLQGVGDLASYLQLAQHSPLRPWVLGMQARQNSHAIELSLRRQFRNYVDEVARWLPGRWKPTLRWLRRLVDLPALQYLLSEAPVPAWMQDDPALRPLAGESLSTRIEALRNSDCRCLLATSWQDRPLYEAWFECWQRHWPHAPAFTGGLRTLGNVLLAHVRAQQPGSHTLTRRRREALVPVLQGVFRRHSFQPAAACAHLAMVALDLERLRGDLLRRVLFAQRPEVRP